MSEKAVMPTNTAEVNAGEIQTDENWNRRLDGESPTAFRAFCMYRDMGYMRTIKKCLEMHEFDEKKYASWSRWSRIFNWKERAALFDEYIAKETERQILNEHVERRRKLMGMLSKLDGIVDRRLDTLNPEDINASGTMDLMERSARLDGFVSGASSGDKKTEAGQLEIKFVESFEGL